MTISSVNKNCFFPCMAWKRTYRASVGVPVQPKSLKITSFPASSSLQVSLPSRENSLPSTDAHTSTLAGRKTCGVRICMKLATDPLYSGHFAQVDGGIQIIGAESLPTPVHEAFTAAKSVEETGDRRRLCTHLCAGSNPAARRIGYLFAVTRLCGSRCAARRLLPSRLISVEKAGGQQYRVFYGKRLSCITWKTRSGPEPSVV